MVQLRPDGWGQPIIGPPIDLPSTVRNNGKEEQRPLPRVHVRIKLTEGEEGSGADVFEDWVDWDVRDPFLKDPETFAVSLGNQFGLSLGAVEELARSVTDQLRRLAASSATVPGASQHPSQLVLPPPVPLSEGVGRLHLMLTPEELQAQASARLAGDLGPQKREAPEWGAYPPGTSLRAYEESFGAHPPDSAPPARAQVKGRRKSVPKLELTEDGPDDKVLAIKRITGTSKEAEALQDFYIEQQIPAIEQVLKSMRIESTRVLRATPTELTIVANASCHGCKHPMDASMQICPRNVGSHTLCSAHFQRFHGLSEADVRALWEANKSGIFDHLPEHLKEHPLPVCLVCSMACPCKVCARFNMRKALDTWQRYINERAGREWDFEGPGMPVMAQLHEETEPIPPEYITQCVARMMSDEDHRRRPQSGDGAVRRKGASDSNPQPPAESKTPPPTRKKPKKPKKRAMEVHLDFCISCQADKKEPLLECAQCPRAYHPGCVRRKMDVKPPSVSAEVKISKAGQWNCEVCRDEEDEPTKLLVPTAAEEGRRDLERDCRRLLDTFLRHELASAFLHPVDDTVAPDYSKFVSTPMCLRDIRQSHFANRGRKGASYDPIPFLIDLKRVWHNCRLYNLEGSLIRCIGDLLEKVFDNNVTQRFLPQMTPEAQVELKTKIETLHQEFTEAMVSLKAQGLVPPSPPPSPGRAAAEEEEEEEDGVEEEEEQQSQQQSQQPAPPKAEQKPPGKYIYKDDYEEEPPEEEEGDEYGSEDEEYRPGKKKKRDSGGSAGGRARGQPKRGRGGRGGGGGRGAVPYGVPHHPMAPFGLPPHLHYGIPQHAMPPRGMPPQGMPPQGMPQNPLVMRFQHEPVPVGVKLQKVTPDMKLLAGQVVERGPNDTYCVQYEDASMEWLDKARVLAHLAAEVPGAQGYAGRGGRARGPPAPGRGGGQVFPI